MNDTYNEIQNEIKTIIPMVNKMRSYLKTDIMTMINQIIQTLNMMNDLKDDCYHGFEGVCYDSIILYTKAIDDILNKINRSPIKHQIRLACRSIRLIIRSAERCS